MTPQFVLIVLAVITAVLLGLIIPLYLRLAKVEEQLSGEDPATAPSHPDFPPAPPLPPAPPMHQESAPQFGAAPEESAEPPPSSFARAPVELSPAEQARLDLQRSVEQARLSKLEATEAPPMVSGPESTVERADMTTHEAGHFEIPCPGCGFSIPISATDEGTRYVCPQCNQPIRFED